MKIMNTSSMYFNKFSSGTILALLALSGMLLLVPAVVPAHAAGNASLPSLTAAPNTLLSANTPVTFTTTNPSSNAYALTSMTIIAPSGWSFVLATFSCPTGLTLLGASSTSAFQCTGTLPPGFSATATGTVTPVTANTGPAATGTFSSAVVDASSSASYNGPTVVLYSIAAGTTVSCVTPIGAGTCAAPGGTNFIAGSAPITVTATLSTNQAGVPIVFSVTTAPSAGFTATVSPTSSTTTAGATQSSATTSFTPSNHFPDTTTITATIGTSGTHGASGVISTVAGSPSTVGWTYAGPTSFNAGKTFYLSTGYFGLPTYAGATRMAEFPFGALSGPFTVSVSDSFGNAIAYNNANLAGVAITVAASGGSGFDNGGTALLSTISCATVGINNCNAAGGGQIDLNYFQGYTYGFVGALSALITGTYFGTAFSVSSTSGNIITGTDTTYTIAAASLAPGAGTTDKITVTPVGGLTQPGVPVTFNLCGFQVGATVCPGVTTGYTGSFVGGGQTGFGATTGGATGTATATYTVDTALNSKGEWNATYAAPTTAAPKTVASAGLTGVAITGPGAAASFTSLVYFDQGVTALSSTPSIVPGGIMYVNVQLVDEFGNPTTNTGVTQIQVQLSVTAPSTIAVQSAYIPFGGSNTVATFGYIQWTVPSTVAVGSVLTLTMNGVVNGIQLSPAPSYTVKVVSPLPTLNVLAPTPSSSGYIYSSTTGVTFKGWANVSAGYSPLTTHIATVGYKVGTTPWVQTAGSGTATDNYILSLFMPVGLSTLQINATDNTHAKNTAVSQVYNVLVDTQPPTFTFSTASSNNGCVTVTAATAEGDFNEALTGTGAFSASFGGVAVSSGAITWAGTQTPGTAGSVAATICGLVSQTATFSVTGSTLAGLSSTNSESLTVTVPFADSVTFNTATATYGTVGAYSGVTVTVTNGWNTAQTLVIYATFKSGTSIYVADGTVTLAAGASAPVFCIDVIPIPAGSYTVTFAAVTTSNQAVSAPTTGITLVT